MEGGEVQVILKPRGASPHSHRGFAFRTRVTVLVGDPRNGKPLPFHGARSIPSNFHGRGSTTRSVEGKSSPYKVFGAQRTRERRYRRETVTPTQMQRDDSSKLRKQAGPTSATRVRKAVITVPAYFTTRSARPHRPPRSPVSTRMGNRSQDGKKTKHAHVSS